MSKTIIVSNRLPVKIYREDTQFSLTPSEGGLATGLGSVYRTGANIWIGWPGMEIEEAAQTQIRQQLSGLNLKPVFLTQEEINQYYEGFSNEILWPVFHYASTYARYEQSYWDYYIQVNRKFCQAVLEAAEPGDMIWIHDYQLLLLAGMLREQLPDISIGFFQHIPFPEFEIFRLIPWRNELLEGILGADLIGFHTYDDVQHFVGSVSRLLPVHASANTITYNDRQIIAEPFPMGIDNEKFMQLTRNAKVRRQLRALKSSFRECKIILSIDRLDYSKGILQRLHAFDLFLELNPQYLEKVILYMVVVPSRDTVPQYQELHDEIDKLVGNINARRRTLHWHPVQYFYQSFPVEMLSALYQQADVCLVTPMRDGMNLVSKEYIASRIKNIGVLILSEMAGASKELIDAIIVNPNNIGEITRAIETALNMPTAEQKKRMVLMRQIIAKFNIHHWVKLFTERLAEVKQLQQSMLARLVNFNTHSDIVRAYQSASERLIFLDYDGTLVGFQNNIEQASPDKELINLLQLLCNDLRNQVVIISGRRYQTLESWFGQLRVDMIAEHGAWQKRFGRKWSRLPTLNNQWKQDLFPVLETYTDRTPGSFIEEKSYSLVWHYRKVETGLGDLRAGELINNLRYLTEDKGLQVMPGNKVVEIKNMDVNKGKAALNWLYNKNYDFILALGDDHTDEDIFKALPNDAYTIKIGSNISAARFYMRDFREARNLLSQLIMG
ncbi:bifunctional alpha,alpha-trehalose-phosphate synthase (UDP-forming)/trehalose-phosphatase [Pedobacter sp. BS3]|uniref:bifunctional alpha,alpha-trehalose-phosphate synthase (UDP-forming)/trehalose-phosphatase n=1 Tax=Pedobacter sp. BS3 TaxID=2567937 RepID=UPI0011EFE9FC|nr:bifunctional alpha,alpha-trehalose-phosphate synthase (UDP-forming)/trehalose-phosphatase [Pedobacter sp. BS3]TZF82735.1 bifunctional alpha,alpha-trehalose-phosphate synthase (UDP-forming)/trehalose-phosphatase [Pedobacter sp. BS3]